MYTSHNPGANLNICLPALKAGSRNCSDDFPLVKQFLVGAGMYINPYLYGTRGIEQACRL